MFFYRIFIATFLLFMVYDLNMFQIVFNHKQKKQALNVMSTKGETIHRMYRNRDYFGDGSVHDTWRPLTIQTI